LLAADIYLLNQKTVVALLHGGFFSTVDLQKHGYNKSSRADPETALTIISTLLTPTSK